MLYLATKRDIVGILKAHHKSILIESANGHASCRRQSCDIDSISLTAEGILLARPSSYWVLKPAEDL